MKCPRCGKPLGMGAGFCMHCGQMLGQPTPQAGAAGYPQPGMTPVAPSMPMGYMMQRRRNAWPWIAVAALILACSIWGLATTGALRFGNRQEQTSALESGGNTDLGRMLNSESQVDPNRMLGAMGSENPTNALSSQGESSPNMLSAQGEQAPSVLPSVSERARMPQDVYDWLRHLEAIERRKERLLSGQESKSRRLSDSFPKPGRTESTEDPDEFSGLGNFSVDGDFLGGVRAKIAQLSEDWKSLTRDFNSYRPPAECRALANTFDQALRETGAQIEDIAGVLDSAMSDPYGAIAKLEASKGSSETMIDKPLEDCDRMLGDICDKYDTPKWFKILSHRGGASMLGSGMGF